MVRAAGLSVAVQPSLPYMDASEVPEWAVPYIAAATESGLVRGVGGGLFAPSKNLTRAEAVTLLTAMLEKID